MPRLTKSAPKKAKKDRMHDEMSKFKNGSLKSSNGKKVTSRKQAIAIGLSESGQSKREKKSDKKKSEGHVKSEKAMTKAANRRSRNKGRS